MNTTGNASRLGASLVDGGVNFSVYSRSAPSVELLLFDQVDDDHRQRGVAALD